MLQHTQLNLFELDLPQPEQQPPLATELLLDGFKQHLAKIKATNTEELCQLLETGKYQEFANACRICMKNFWKQAPKAARTPRAAFRHLFLQLQSQENLTKAVGIIRPRVHSAALKDFYHARDDIYPTLPSIPVDISSTPKVNLEALQARFDELFARRKTTAEFIYLKMLLDGIEFSDLEQIAVGIDDFAGLKPTKKWSLQRALATYNREHALADAYIKGVKTRW